MTLADMADFVCAKVRQQDDSSKTRCKAFLRQRYEVIWAEEMWKDSLFLWEFTFDVAGDAADVAGPNAFGRSVGVWHAPSSVDRPLALRMGTRGIAVEDDFQPFRDSLDVFAETGAPINFIAEGQVAADLRGVKDTVEASSCAISANVSDDTAVVRLRYIDLNGEEQVTDVTLDSTNQPTFAPQLILSVTKSATNEDVSVTLSGDTVLTVAAADTCAKRYSRLRLIPIPSEDVALKCLVKTRAQRLTDDNDEPSLRGVENCLMAFAQADMLERSRQYAKADRKYGEAGALLKQLKGVEVVQEARRTQILPEVAEVSGGYPSEYQGKEWI